MSKTEVYDGEIMRAFGIASRISRTGKSPIICRSLPAEFVQSDEIPDFQ